MKWAYIRVPLYAVGSTSEVIALFCKSTSCSFWLMLLPNDSVPLNELFLRYLRWFRRAIG